MHFSEGEVKGTLVWGVFFNLFLFQDVAIMGSEKENVKGVFYLQIVQVAFVY